jgi:Tfp pilus assembly protein PilX
MTTGLQHAAYRLRDERGMALVMAIGISFVLAVLGASVILFTTSNERQASRQNGATRVYAIAQAGIDAAASQIGALDDRDRHLPASFVCEQSLATTPNCSESIDGRTVHWSGTLTGSGPTDYVWHLTSTATMADPANAGKTLRRTVTADLQLAPAPEQLPNTDAWKYVYSKANDGDPNTCDQTIYNNPGITSSFYVNGDLCLDNSSNVWGPLPGEPPVDVVVKGRAYLNHPSTSLGSDGRHLSRVEVDLGCKYKFNPITVPPTPCDQDDRVWPDSVFPGKVGTDCELGCPVVNPPPADFVNWYTWASPGPMVPCEQSSGGSALPVFDTDTTRSITKPVRTVDLAPATDYSCTTKLGKLAWDHTTRTLTVEGTVYLDANADFSSDGVIEYRGFGAVYVNGALRLRQTIICGDRNDAGDGCDAVGWNAAGNPPNVLVFVTKWTGSPAATDAGMTFEQSSGFQGALYSAGDMTFENNTWVQGPMIAERQVITNSMYFHFIPDLVKVPFGAPGAVIEHYNLTPVKHYAG